MQATQAKMPLTHPQGAQELLKFYEDFVTYYRGWAKFHRSVYWILLGISIACGVSVTWLLLLRADALHVAEVALALNSVLIISYAVGPDRKYPRYRMVEIRLMFELQRMRHSVALRIKNGEEPESALLSALEDLHIRVESLVLEEFGEYFRDFTKIKDLRGQVAEKDN